MRRVTALGLAVIGEAVLALLAPPVAAVPAFASFLAAGLILSR